MTETAFDTDVPVEPVWYEAPAVEDVAAPVEALGVAAAPVPEHAPVPVPDDILPPAESPAAVEPAIEQPPVAEPKPPRPSRRWRTPHLVGAVVLALLIGFVVGRVTDSSGGGTSSSSSARRSSATSPGSGGQPSAGTQQSQTPAGAPGATPTSAAPGSVNGHTVLLNIPRHTGQLITDHFTVSSNRWVLGWAYDCTAAPGGTGAFNVKVFDGAGNESSDGGVNQQGAKGSSVVAYTSTGERYLWVTTNCVWAIRVTS